MKPNILNQKPLKSKYKQLIFFILLTLFSVKVQAQYVIKEADKQFEYYNYSEAVKLYLKAWKKKEGPYTAQRIAESYRKMNNYEAAEEWYARLSGMQNSSPESKLWHAEALRSQGKYKEAKTQYQQYTGQAVSVAQVQLWITSCDSAIAWMAVPKDIKIENEKKLNSQGSDWAAVKYADGIVFTSDRTPQQNETTNKRPFLKFDGTKLPDKHTYRWTGMPYMHLYYSQGDQVNIFPLANTNDYHTGVVSFTNDGKEAYFTMTSTKDWKSYNQALNTIYIGLYSSRFDSGKWSDPIPFRYTNTTKWSVGDPYISPDGQTLYFVSDMPGGNGGTDIYKSNRNADGTWSDAVNLGTTINTPGNERSPSVYNNILYFSSDGHIGMGGLDIYKTTLDHQLKVVNMGYPMNSPQDDFATSLTSETSGFLSSNRMNGAGKDDIYTFSFSPEKPILPAVVPVSPVIAEKPVAPAPVIANRKPDSIYVENIYYYFDKSNIRNDAAVILSKVHKLMEQNPSSQLFLSAHTDSKGTKDYNLHLSKQRAAAAVKYLTDRGIGRSRIQSSAFGEAHPVAPNTLNGHDNPAGRQLNRRTEIKLTLKIR